MQGKYHFNVMHLENSHPPPHNNADGPSLAIQLRFSFPLVSHGQNDLELNWTSQYTDIRVLWS